MSKELQYVGARYVPKIADPVEWQPNASYEPLTIVTRNGNSYTSRVFVPAGNDPFTSPDFWAATGNYNAQVEQYRQDVSGIAQSQKSMEAAIGVHTDEIEELKKSKSISVTPEQFGAVGDGVANDTAAVQAAFDVGGSVTLYRTYKVDGVYLRKDSTTVSGGGTILGNIFMGGSAENVTVDNETGTIVRLEIVNITMGGAIYLRRCRNFRISGVTFLAREGYAIYRDTTVTIPEHRLGYGKIENCRSAATGFIQLPLVDGDAEFPINDLTISENQCNPLTSSFLTASRIDGAKIVNNYIQYRTYVDWTGGTMGTAITIDGWSDWLTISGNTIFGHGRSAIILALAKHFNISNNTIGWGGHSVISDAIVIRDGGLRDNPDQWGEIVNNIISKQSGNGVYINTGRYVKICGNVMDFILNPPYVGDQYPIKPSMMSAKTSIVIPTGSPATNLLISGNIMTGYTLNVTADNSNNVSSNTVDGVAITDRIPSTTNALGGGTLPNPSRFVHLSTTGAVSLSNIGRRRGETVTLVNTSNNVVTIVNGDTIHLAGAANFAMKRFATLTLYCIGGAWVEIARSAL